MTKKDLPVFNGGSITTEELERFKILFGSEPQKMEMGVGGRTTNLHCKKKEENIQEDGDFPSIDVLSIAIIAAAMHGEDLETWGNGAGDALFNTLRRERGGNVGGLCIGLVAMAHMGDNLPSTAVGGLKSFQNDDGGFGEQNIDDSDVVISAICAHTLQLAEEQEALDAVISYLADQQLEDGGWTDFGESDSDSLTTAFVLVGLNAAGQDLADWETAVAIVEGGQDRETGMVLGFEDEPFTNVATTALAILAWGGYSLNPSDMMAEETASVAGISEETDGAAADDDFPEGPALDTNWGLISDGFEDPTVAAGLPVPLFDTADDFFVTVVDPFTDDELYGVQIINWTAEYQYTGYIIENFLPAEVLLFMGEQDPTTWENIAVTTLQLLPADVLAQLPEDVQARAAE